MLEGLFIDYYNRKSFLFDLLYCCIFSYFGFDLKKGQTLEELRMLIENTKDDTNISAMKNCS